jgi:DNA primase
MQFSSDFLSKIKNAVSVVEIVGRKVKLNNVGAQKFKGLCPFHGEKSPSFFVNEDYKNYHCFGCGVSGDAISFIMETTGAAFPEVVEELANLAGIPMPKIDKFEAAKQEKAKSIYDLVEIACKFYEENLSKNSEAQKYLDKRGLPASLVKKFRIGYVPPQNAAIAFLQKQNFTLEEIALAGIAKKSDKNGKYYDLLQNRIIFPISDSRGRVIAFGGRVLDDSMPKYINSPETPLFKKGETLYAVDIAKNMAFKSKNLIVAEGYMDVIAFHQYGFINAVAPLGTAMTEANLRNLWVMVNEPTICLDGDDAGRKAMARLMELALPILKAGYSLRFVVLPNKQDPDDVLQALNGKATMQNYLRNATPLSEALWNYYHDKKPIKTPEQRAAFQESLMAITAKIQDEGVRAQYKRFFTSKLREFNNIAFIKNKRKTQPLDAKTEAKKKNVEFTIRSEESELFRVLISNIKLLQNAAIEEEFAHLEFSNKNLAKLQNHLLEKKDEFTNKADLLVDLERHNLINILDLFRKKLDGLSNKVLEMDDSKAKKEWQQAINLYILASMREDYETLLQTGEPALEDKAFKLLENIRTLEQQLYTNYE